jgi:hypothetical protein
MSRMLGAPSAWKSWSALTAECTLDDFGDGLEHQCRPEAAARQKLAAASAQLSSCLRTDAVPACST